MLRTLETPRRRCEGSSTNDEEGAVETVEHTELGREDDEEVEE